MAKPCKKPDDEFLSIVHTSAAGGEWTTEWDLHGFGSGWGMEADEDFDPADYPLPESLGPLPHEERMRLLGLAQVGGMDASVVLAALAIWQEGGNLTAREVQYELGRRLGEKQDWKFQDEIRHAQLMKWGESRVEGLVHAEKSMYPPLCLVCRRLLYSDGRPRVFRAEELSEAGQNLGRDLPDWLPTWPPLHVEACRHRMGPLEVWGSGGLYLRVSVPKFVRIGDAVLVEVTRLPSWEVEDVLVPIRTGRWSD